MPFFVHDKLKINWVHAIFFYSVDNSPTQVVGIVKRLFVTVEFCNNKI